MDRYVESKDLTLEQLFNEFYVVPTYQREFVWTGEEVTQLLEDVHTAYLDSTGGQGPDGYFIGSVVVCPSSTDTAVWEIIDGQQRLTTAYIFLCAVRDHLVARGSETSDVLKRQIASTHLNDDGEDVSRFRISLQYEDSLDVLESIAAHTPDATELARDKYSEPTSSVENIFDAYDTIRTFLATSFESDLGEVRRFYAFFTRRVQLIRIKTTDVASALKIFETINDRGVGLNAMDLLKNLMFMNATHSQYETLNRDWKKLVDELWAAREKPLRFLRYYVFARWQVDGFRLREDDLYQWFVNNAEQVGYEDDPVTFVKTLYEAATDYIHFSRGEDRAGSYNRPLSNIKRMHTTARQHLILALAGRHLEPPDFNRLTQALEDVLFVHTIAREPARFFERKFAQWAPDLRAVDGTPELERFITDTIEPTLRAATSRFALGMRELREGHLRKYQVRYVLAKLSQHIDEQAWGSDFVREVEDYVQRSNEVEHILPQGADEQIKEAYGGKELFELSLRKLGNLTLLEKPLNRAAKNKPFSEKREFYAASGILLTQSIAVGKESQGFGKRTTVTKALAQLRTWDHWSDETIRERQEVLLRLAWRVWGLPGEPPAEDEGQDADA